MRGHRVSNCQHADRPLQHINKKVCLSLSPHYKYSANFVSQGRPVSQCPHCRNLRKARSAHVRCDCGAEEQLGIEVNHNKGTNCSCNKGTRCSCALKKEHLYPVPESDSDEASSTEVQRPRAHTAQSESGLTVFSNGLHKPVHKNNMAHKCGLPYVVPRTPSIHGLSPAGLANRSVDNLPHTSTIDALHSESRIKDSMVSAQQEQRLVKSENGSPIMSPTSNLDQLNGFLPPLDLSHIPADFDFYSTMPDAEQPLFSAGLSAASIDWSHYDGLDFNNDDFATSSYSQAPSFTGFDFGSMDQPALTTTSTSGEISEVEDFGPVSDKHVARPALLNRYGSDFENSDFGGDIDGYRLSTASTSIGLPRAQILASNNVEALDIDDFLKGIATSNGYSSHGPQASFADGGKNAQAQSFDDNDNRNNNNTFQLSAEEENQAFWLNDFTSNNLAINTGRDEVQVEDLWAQ